jgi:probable DNA metabolism protein
MKIITINNFGQWRDQARAFLYDEIAPEEIEWQEADSTQTTLFIAEPPCPHYIAKKTANLKVPRNFLALAEKVACHRDAKKWFLLYKALWRITHGEHHLLEVISDPLTHQLLLMRKAVSRDAHKMKAFVRFRLYKAEQQEHYVAWHQPQHKVLHIVAPFFKERFNVMHWAIFTPDGSVSWDGEQLLFSETAHVAEIKDDTEALWLTYYRSIFNPARIKLKAMHKEMPTVYWSTMPETKLISELVREAPQKVAKMLKER